MRVIRKSGISWCASMSKFTFSWLISSGTLVHATASLARLEMICIWIKTLPAGKKATKCRKINKAIKQSSWVATVASHEGKTSICRENEARICNPLLALGTPLFQIRDKGCEVRWNSIWRETVASSVCHRILSGRYDGTYGLPRCHANALSSHLTSLPLYKESEVRWNSIWRETMASSVCHKILSGRYDGTYGLPLFHAECCFISPHFPSFVPFQLRDFAFYRFFFSTKKGSTYSTLQFPRQEHFSGQSIRHIGRTERGQSCSPEWSIISDTLADSWLAVRYGRRVKVFMNFNTKNIKI